MEPNPYIDLHGITKTFPGVKALDDVSFTIHAGEVHAIVGENGAGKSTLINIIAGNYHPDSGNMEIKGKRVRIRDYSDALSMGISVVYQERSLVPNLSVAENVFVNRQPKTRLNLIDKKKVTIQLYFILTAVTKLSQRTHRESPISHLFPVS